MRYLKEFANANEIQTALENGELGKPYVAYIESEDRIDWNTKFIDYSKKYLTFKITSAGTINVPTGTTYSIDGGEWENTGTTLAVNGGKSIRFKGTNGSYFVNSFGGSTAGFNVEGNIMSLIYGDNFIGQTSLNNSYTFVNLFDNCTDLTSAENLILPATTLAGSCYQGMFSGCTSLATAPELPATTLTNNCYQSMFGGCSSLTTAPELPATTLANSCYYQMFYGCRNLNYIKCLATDKSAYDCTKNWTYNVSTSGTFVKAAGVTWQIDVPSSLYHSGIPSGWTVQEV